MNFFREFIASPSTTASIAPSSRFLAEAVVADLSLKTADVVLEYGPGTGVLTDLILRELKPGAKFAAIELNPRFAEMFEARYPSVQMFQDSVGNVREICKRGGMKSVDCVVSGLPWALFSESQQVEYLDAMLGVLSPGGRFSTFTYLHSSAFLPGARRFASLLPNYFKTVKRSPVVWLNFPPAFVYRCRR